MLIKSLYVKNFRQFKGETHIDFACDKEKNVTIILGDNTYGKTTLLQMFNWCLYDFVMFDKDSNPDMLLNLELKEKMRLGSGEKVEVRIVLIHNNTEYTVSRTQDYIGANDKVLGEKSIVTMSYKLLESDGQTDIRKNYIEKTINEILPKNLSNFFFFDTERVRDVSNRKDIGEAVKALLGLTALDNAVKHLGSKTAKTSVLGKLYLSMDSDGDQKATQAINRINQANTLKEEIAKKLLQTKENISLYEVEKERLDSILREGQSTASLQERSLHLERMIKQENSTLDNHYDKYIREYCNGAVPFFAKPLMLKALDFLKDAEVDDKGIKDMTAQSIKDIIDRGKCICGQEIVEGQEAYNNIIKELAFLPPESIGTTIRNFKEKTATLDSANKNYFETIKSRYEDILRTKTNIQEYTDEAEDIWKKINGKDDMKKYSEKLLETKERLKTLNEEKERLIREDESCNSDIGRFQKLYDGLVAVSSKNKSLMTQLRYAEAVLTWIKATYQEKEADIRESLEEKVNEIFGKIYHGRRRVSINDKYIVSLLTTIGEKEIASGESEGLNRVKNFAFIAGLVELAKGKIVAIAGDEEIDLSSEPYPLVLDAPFSNADATHTTNISKVLPEVAEQVIMFVMEKDWRYAEPVMAFRVGAKWGLHKVTDTYTELKRSEA